MSTTIKDLARESAVSASTVSYVLNNGPRPVSRHIREKVLATAARMNYHPNAVARGLSRKRMDTLGVVYTYWDAEITDYYFISILHGILGSCMRHGQATTLFTSHVWSKVEDDLSLFANGRCDGLIIVAPPLSCTVMSLLTARNIPCIVVSDTLPDSDISSVNIDNQLAMYQITQYLLDLGHQRIAMLCGDNDQRSTPLRIEGFRRAFSDAGHNEDKHLIISGSYCFQSGYESALKMLDLPAKRRPTALCCANDAIAAGALKALMGRGVKVPEEISVTGFDDTPLSSTAPVPLTSVRQPFGTIGMRAAELLLARIEGDQSHHSEQLPTEIVERDSTAPPKK